MGDHLKAIHNMYPPPKENMNENHLSKVVKRQRNQRPAILTVSMLRTAIAYLIAEADLPYAIVEHQSFIRLLELLNPTTINMEYGRKTIAKEVESLFHAHRDQLQQTLKDVKHLAFTLDAWTSPNQKAFMAITAHGITADWKMLEVVVAMPTVHGQHSGENFGNLFVDSLNKLGLSDALVSITADNASNNSTLARQVENRLGRSIFKADTQLLGCMAHVINLAAHDGIKVFGVSPTTDHPIEQEITLNHMDSYLETVQPDGAGINLQTVVNRIHGLATYVRNTPQRREAFIRALDLINSQEEKQISLTRKGKKKMLNLDVRTRWNSTFKMLNRALELKEWDKVTQITHFLEPLYDVTNMLCRSKYPTLSMALPIYISLIRSIYSIRSTYDAEQLIPAADVMIVKLKKYLTLALKKPAPICAMILDPRIKLSYFEKTHAFLVEHDISTLRPSEILNVFKNEAVAFDQSPSKIGQVESPPRPMKASRKLSVIEADIFGQGPVLKDLDSEIQQYLSEPNEKQTCQTLYYWSQHKKIYPSLAAMAGCFLGIPATSAPSERVFSRAKTIVGSQRHSLSTASIERLLCVKDWYQSGEEKMDTSNNLPDPQSFEDSDDNDSDREQDE
ncbi:hypothetical protein PSHT_00550 [Puccinia striiformis]|uniref:HAT C-terminal dimerisation domain-containing protein n=1 Tax=Puccinia striiformis TaxID=27350 RepID=A0A2S4WMY4_9BASI|nr:hypothetical protein PSHT_00550 [Puccinia striiformis]